MWARLPAAFMILWLLPHKHEAAHLWLGPMHSSLLSVVVGKFCSQWFSVWYIASDTRTGTLRQGQQSVSQSGSWRHDSCERQAYQFLLYDQLDRTNDWWLVTKGWPQITWLVSNTQVCQNSSLCSGVKEKEKTMPFNANLMRSQQLYRAAQLQWSCWCTSSSWRYVLGLSCTACTHTRT